jgi:hypothetical protein
MSNAVRIACASAILLMSAAVVSLLAQGPQGPSAGAMHHGCGHGAHGAGHGCAHHATTAGVADDHAADMEVFHYLLDQGPKIRRTVTRRPDGVETLTESDDPEVAEKIRVHVASMYDRVEEGRPIHQRDPLFRAVFAHANKIVFKTEPTGKGVRVTQTSTDPKVVALIQAHADVVSKFIANGRSEAHVNHDVPGESKD